MKAPTWKDEAHRFRFLELLTQARILNAPVATDDTLAAIMLDRKRRTLAAALYVLAAVHNDWLPYFDNEAEDMAIFGHSTPNWWDVLDYQGEAGTDDRRLLELAAHLYGGDEYLSATGGLHHCLQHLGQRSFRLAIESLCWRYGTECPVAWERLHL